MVDPALNLPADADVIEMLDKDDPATYNLTTAVTVFDAGGNEYLATIFYQKTKRATSDDPTNKFQTHVYRGNQVEELLIQATDSKGEQLFVNKYGEVFRKWKSSDSPEDIARGITKLFNLDDLKNKQDLCRNSLWRRIIR